MSRTIVLDLDCPDVQALELLWDELRARHAAMQSDRLHLEHQAHVRELQERTPDRPALGSFLPQADVADLPRREGNLRELFQQDPDWTLTVLVASSVSLGFPVAEVIDIALTFARDAGVTDEVSVPLVSKLVVRCDG